MSTTVVCPQCTAKLKAPEQLQGKTVKCPRCQTGVAIPLAPAEDDFELLEEAETTADGAATVAENEPEVATVQPVEPAKPAAGPERKRRRRKKRKGFFDRLPAIGVDERIVMGGMALVGLLVFGGCFFTG